MGPPLEVSLHRRGIFGDKYKIVWDEFARDYAEHGIEYTRAVPGMPELLGRLHAHGVRLGIATSKPQACCERTLRLCGYAGPSELEDAGAAAVARDIAALEALLMREVS